MGMAVAAPDLEPVPPLSHRSYRAWLRANLRRARDWAEREGCYADPASRSRLLSVFDRAEQAALAAALD